MKKKNFYRAPVRIQLHSRRRWKRGPDRRVADIPDGWDLAEVDVYVDPEALAHEIGWRAAASQTRTTKLAGGAILIKLASLKHKPEEGGENP